MKDEKPGYVHSTVNIHFFPWAFPKEAKWPNPEYIGSLNAAFTVRTLNNHSQNLFLFQSH